VHLGAKPLNLYADIKPAPTLSIGARSYSSTQSFAALLSGSLSLCLRASE
jgi:hypothetical protein